MTIRLLPDDLINKIAAGEVVERPASVVKELVENAIDACATEVFVTLSEGGKGSIEVADNGIGMGKDDALLSIERHATSKLRTTDDLEAITSLGFRGEALPSIASVSRFTLVTSDSSGPAGTRIEIEGGRIKKVADAPSPRGTVIEVADLFFNVPARRKFLKGTGTELAHIAHVLDQIAFCYPALHVRLTNNKRLLADYPPVKTLVERACQILGPEMADGLLVMDGGEEGLRVRGLLSRPGFSRGDKKYQELFVNGRWVRNNILNHAVYEAYHSLLMRDRHPMVFLFLEVDPAGLDVNVHPAKSEVRFHESRRVHEIVKRTLQETLLGDGAHRFRSEAGSEYRPEQTAAREVSPAPDDNFFPSFAPRVREAGAHYRQATPGQSATLTERLLSEPAFISPSSPLPCFQVHQSYIVVETAEGLEIVDQHAAHERILYDRYRRALGAGRAQAQGLLFPVRVSLPTREASVLVENFEMLGRMGLDLEDFGGGSFLVRGLPNFLTSLSDTAITGLLSEIAGEFLSVGKSSSVGDIEERLTLLFICRSSVRANQRLEEREMRSLLAQLEETDAPATCPHGRPIKIFFTMREIERMFKRSS